MSRINVDHGLAAAMGHHQAGRLAQAENLYRQVLAQQPNNATALHLLGVIAGQVGRPDAAIELIRQAISIQPNDPHFHNNLGKFLADMRRFDEAIPAYKESLRLRPGVPETFDNLGTSYYGKGMADEALAAFREAIRLKPHAPESHNNLANILREKEMYDQALASVAESLRLSPTYVPAYATRGMILQCQGDIDGAIRCFHQALQLRPNFWQAQNNLGNAYKDAGRIKDAIAAYRVLLQMNPSLVHAHSTLLFAQHMDETVDAPALLAAHRQWNATFAAPLAKQIQPHPNQRDPNRRLKIGYVSGDFRDHAAGRFMLPLLAHHNHAAVEVYCYSEVAMEDAVTRQINGHADHWREMMGVHDEEIARQIRADQIDILVDLSMHSAGSRLLAFARKPAPIQVTYLAYCSTTGMDAMDYRISDQFLDPDGTDDHYSEKTVRLSGSYWCYQPPQGVPDINALPAAATGTVTFGSLNNFCKVSDGTLAAWCKILQSIPSSRLLLHAHTGSHRDRILKGAADAGIDPQRIDFVGYLSLPDYFAAYRRMDIALDPFPYGGGTTTCDALWMGVPVITRAGQTGVGRGGVSILSHVGLQNLVTHNAQEYVQKAVELAANPSQVAEWRSGMRQRMRNSPLMDAPRLAREMETTYRTMWLTWCDAAPNTLQSR